MQLIQFTPDDTDGPLSQRRRALCREDIELEAKNAVLKATIDGMMQAMMSNTERRHAIALEVMEIDDDLRDVANIRRLMGTPKKRRRRR